MTKMAYIECRDCGGVYCITTDWCESECNKPGGKNTKRLEKLVRVEFDVIAEAKDICRKIEIHYINGIATTRTEIKMGKVIKGLLKIIQETDNG